MNKKDQMNGGVVEPGTIAKAGPQQRLVLSHFCLTSSVFSFAEVIYTLD